MTRATCDAITVNMTAVELALALKVAGIPVGDVQEADDTVDGMIVIGGGLHVQVGVGYALVQREILEGGRLAGIETLGPLDPAGQCSVSAVVAVCKAALAPAAAPVPRKRRRSGAGRCPDCGAKGEIKGHQACPYPQD